MCGDDDDGSLYCSVKLENVSSGCVVVVEERERRAHDRSIVHFALNSKVEGGDQSWNFLFLFFLRKPSLSLCVCRCEDGEVGRLLYCEGSFLL